MWWKNQSPLCLNKHKDSSSIVVRMDVVTVSFLASNQTSFFSEESHEKSSTAVSVQAVSLIMIMTGALFFSSLTIGILLRVPSLWKILHNRLILNLCVADLGVALFSMPFSLVSVFDEGKFLMSHDVICQINGFSTLFFAFTNQFLILAIALDRLLIVVFFRRFPPKSARTYIQVAMSWIGAALAALSGTTGLLTNFAYNSSTKHCSPTWKGDLLSTVTAILNFGFIVPLLIVCYVIITCFIWKEGLNLRKYQLTVALNALKSTPSKLVKAIRKASTSSETRTSTSGFTTDDEDNKTEDRTGPTLNPVKLPISSRGSVNVERPTNRIDKLVARRRRSHEAHKRVAITGGLLVFTNLVCWIPYFLFHAEYIPVPEGHWFGVFTMWLVYSNSLLDPLVYAFMNRRVRAEIKRLTKVMFGCSRTKLCFYSGCQKISYR